MNLNEYSLIFPDGTERPAVAALNPQGLTLLIFLRHLA